MLGLPMNTDQPFAQPVGLSDGAVTTSTPSSLELDLESEEPLVVCPMRKEGMGPEEICDACQ